MEEEDTAEFKPQKHKGYSMIVLNQHKCGEDLKNWDFRLGKYTDR